MPITEFMSGFRTDPETRRLMGLAFELTRVTLRLSDRKDPLIQLVADRIRTCEDWREEPRAPL
jgi:hypothetical protein